MTYVQFESPLLALVISNLIMLLYFKVILNRSGKLSNVRLDRMQSLHLETYKYKNGVITHVTHK